MKAPLTRRAFCAAVIAAPVSTTAAERVRASDLWAGGGQPSDIAKRLEGQIVAMRGYMAPPLRAEARFFVLTRIPMAVCPFCDSEASWPEDLVVVEIRDRLRPVDFNDLVEATGRLELGTKVDLWTGFSSRARLVDAAFARV